MIKTKTNIAIALIAIAGTLASCNNNGEETVATTIEFKNQSVTPVFLKAQPGFENVQTFGLISSDDILTESPDFIFGGSADGAGLIKNANGTYSFVVNHEDNFSVSRITLNSNFKPVKGEYILNSNGGTWRLCSATMATTAEHGFGPLFLTCGESGEDSRTHGIDPTATALTPSVSKELAGLGRWSAENAVPLNKKAYAGKTVVILGDDDSGTEGGQLAMYVSNNVGDLNNGEVYVMRRKDLNVKERDMVVGSNYDVEFVKVSDAKILTGRQIQIQTVSLSAMKFGRVEDIDYRKGSDAGTREVYFNVTGQNNVGANADFSRTKYGRTYRIVLDAADPLKGKLEVILDGDDRTGIAKAFQNPDNIMVTQNFVYVQEDPNSYGDETHDAFIYQYNIATKELKRVFELDHRRTTADAIKYNPTGSSSLGSWEYGALIDVSDIVGSENTFMLAIQPHTWRGLKYVNPDKGTLRPSEDQTSQIVLIKGLPK